MYAFNIDYHHKNSHRSGVSGAATTLEQARKDLEHHIEYYTKECPVHIDVAEIVHVCDKCNGVGEIVKRYKRSKFMVKRTPCQDCNGQGTTQHEKWDVAN
jgi:DnaJ-class molecular chaperone